MVENDIYRDSEIVNKMVCEFCHKHEIDIEKLSVKTRSLLFEAAYHYEKQLFSWMESFKECISTKYTVESFCNNQNISRSTIYKKNLNGHLNYKPVIDFINEYNDTFDFVTSRRMKKYLRELSFDVNLLESLLKKEAQYMDQNHLIAQKDSQIKSLERQIKELKKQIDYSKRMN
ncbi:MAG: hypothetical protein E7192_01735 [Erysipelotrichaceae bacterium]|nr:hypothetical protein [Erysipelotrichaceae bacterium]